MLGSLWERGKLKLAVDSATSTADEPTPIYVLDELVQELGAGDSRAGVDAVCARLAHRSPVVKQKALKVVAHIGRKGSADLRRLMARHSGAVRDLLHFRCEPDPFKGDTVWKRVQEYAQEALNAIHGEPEAAAPSSSGLRGRIQGFGSEAAGGYSGGSGGGMLGFGSESAGGYGGSGGGSSGRMVGFGSADVMQSGMQAISSGMRTLSGGRYDDYSGAQLDGGSYSGGYSGGSGGSSRAGAAGLTQGPIVQAGAVTPPSAPAGSSATAGTGSSGGGAEQRAVERICTPAGLRTAPSREDLRAFVDAIASLDGTAVAQLLQRKLEAGPWQASLRALCAIEAALESSRQAACGQVAAHFKARPEAVRAAADSPQASVRQRAQKLLGALGGGAAAPAPPGSDSAAASQQPLFTEDLLGEAEGSIGAGSTSAAGLANLLGEAAAPASSTAAPAADLLAGLDVPAAAAASTQPPAQPSAAAPAAAGEDLFGGMLLDSQPAASSAPPVMAAPAVVPVTASTSPLDLLGGLSLGGPGSSAAAPTSAAAAPPVASAAPGFDDLLGGLSLGNTSSAPAMGTARANGAASGIPLQPAAGMAGPSLGNGSMGWGGAPMGGAAQPLGGALADSLQQGAGLGGLNSHGPFHQSGPAGVGGLQGLQFSQQPAQQPVRLPSLGSLGSGPLPSGVLAHSGILDSSRDNAFNFVHDALAAAKRKQ